MRALRRLLDELVDLAEELRRFDEKRQRCEDILEQIEEIRELLDRDDLDELDAFRALIVLLETLKGLGGKVPLLEEFMELYITAMKSALYVIETSIASHGPIHDTCMHYCRERAKRERLLREEAMETDEEEIAKNGHWAGMLGVGVYQYEKHEDQFRAQYADYVKKLELEDLIAKAKKIGDAPGGTPTGVPADEAAEPSSSGPPPEDWEKIHARLMAWIEVGRQLAGRAAEIQRQLERDDLDTEERRELERELDRLKDIIKRLFG